MGEKTFNNNVSATASHKPSEKSISAVIYSLNQLVTTKKVIHQFLLKVAKLYLSQGNPRHHIPQAEQPGPSDFNPATAGFSSCSESEYL